MRGLCIFKEVESSDFCYGLVLNIDEQVLGFVRGMAYLNLFADELCRAFIQQAADGDGRVIFDMAVESYLKGGVQFFLGKPFDRDGLEVLCLKHLLLA